MPASAPVAVRVRSRAWVGGNRRPSGLRARVQPPAALAPRRGRGYPTATARGLTRHDRRGVLPADRPGLARGRQRARGGRGVPPAAAGRVALLPARGPAELGTVVRPRAERRGGRPPAGG